ncbi:molecular chaperone [Coemansia sp. RSA 2706]|nr:molecular chaperone [Coemansia sp. RSA 2711]KAJ2297393.1 molecular chaperone [Coemansia sp. RSA 2705]KAJ2299065.1 molecular chaperone [Coemansia sp. RSA 2706]KAJ2304030.1 molecular chaperone [Coemansia sp. RSA 2704]KAJ2710446.1 molecular chaperone [Coemansia sp. Cherry 401B]
MNAKLARLGRLAPGVAGGFRHWARAGAAHCQRWPRWQAQQRQQQGWQRSYTTPTRMPGGGSSATRTCWRCQQETSQASVLCENTQCAAIQPVAAVAAYFDVLVGGPPTFDVDTAQLRRSFLRLQQAVHPDSFSQRAAAERQLADAQSAWINEAYATLRDPLARAHYLLRLRGRAVGEEATADAQTLAEAMAAREEIEAATTEAQAAELAQRIGEQVAAAEATLSRAFGGGDLDAAQRLTVRLQYLRRAAQALQSRW